jgi:hypothetical protein
VETLRLTWYLLQYLIGKLHLLPQQVDHYAQFRVSISLVAITLHSLKEGAPVTDRLPVRFDVLPDALDVFIAQSGILTVFELGRDKFGECV